MQDIQVRSLGREDSPGGGNGNPFQYSHLGNPMDRGAWWATVHGVVKSWTRLSMHQQAANNKQEGLEGCSFRPLSSVQPLSHVWLFATPGLQHARLPCPSPTPGVCSNSCLLSRWCHPTISSSVVPFSSHLQSFPASGSFPISQFFASGGQGIQVSAKYWSFSFRSLSSLLCTSPHQIVKYREAWHAVVHGVAKSWTCLSDFTTTPPQKSHPHPSYRPSDSQAKLHIRII